MRYMETGMTDSHLQGTQCVIIKLLLELETFQMASFSLSELIGCLEMIFKKNPHIKRDIIKNSNCDPQLAGPSGENRYKLCLFQTYLWFCNRGTQVVSLKRTITAASLRDK